MINNLNIKTTLKQAIDFFLNNLYANNNSKQTIICYKRDLNMFKNFVKANFTGIRHSTNSIKWPESVSLTFEKASWK